MCDCLTRVFGVSWSPAASSVFQGSGGRQVHGSSPPFSTPGRPSPAPQAERVEAAPAASLSTCRGPGRADATPPLRQGLAESGAHGLEGRPGPPPSCPAAPGPRVPGSGCPERWNPAQRPDGRTGRRAVAESQEPEDQEHRIRCPTPLAEQKRNDQPAQPQIPTAPQLHLAPEDAGDAGRAAQKEQLHAELKRVLRQKGRSRPGPEEAEEEEEEEEAEKEAAPLAAPAAAAAEEVEEEEQLPAMEKTSGTAELLEVIVETEAEVGLSGMSVAGGGREGIFVKDVLKGSPAARALNLREGDQLLSARVYFDNMKYEDALQILKSAEPYRISFCLKRTVPGTDMPRSPGAPVFEGRGPKAKMAKLNIQRLTSLKKKPKKAGKGLAKDLQEPAGSKQEVPPVDVEFSLPKFSKLRKAKSTGEVAVAQPSPDLSPLLSSLETKRRKLRLPRLKVKEALAARAGVVEGWMDGAFPKASGEQKAAAKGGTEAKASGFPVLFSKDKKPKEAGAAKGEGGFQAPQVELDLPLPIGGPGGQSPRAGPKHEGFAAQVLPLELPQVEMVLPKGSPVGPRAPEEGFPAGLRLPTAEVAAPKVDVGLILPRLEGAPQEVAPKGEGFQLPKVPKVGISAEETRPGPLDIVLGKGRGRADGLEEKATVGVKMPALEVGLPSVDLEVPLPWEKAEIETPMPKIQIPDVSRKVPAVSLPKLGSKHPEEERRVPQVELSVGKPESPKAKAKSPPSQTPGLGISLMERMPESKEAAAVPVDSKIKSLGLKVPSLDISAPKVTDMKLPKALVGLTAPAPGAKAEAATEGARFKLQMPEVSLPKCGLPDKAVPSPPQVSAQVPKPKGAGSETAGIPALGLSWPAVQLPKGHVPKPELGLSVDRPQLELGLLPSASAAALELELPKVGIGLDLPKLGSERVVPDHPPRDQEAKLKMPTLESLSKDLEVELRVPRCREEQLELEPGLEGAEGPTVGAIVARIPKVDLAFGKGQAGESAVVHKEGVEWEGAAKGGQMKLPSVEISAVKFPEVTPEKGPSLEPEAKLKSPKFALPKFSISGPKVWKVSDESFAAQAEGPDAADKGSKLKMPKFGISFLKFRGAGEVEGPKPAPGGEGRTRKERTPTSAPEEEPSEGRGKLPSVALPLVDVEMPQLAVDISLPGGRAESSDEEGTRMLPEVGIECPDLRQKVPKFSLVKSGGKEKEGHRELETGGAKRSGSREALAGELGAKARGSKFKMSLFGMGVGPEAESKSKKGPESPKEKSRGPLVKMPKLKRSSPKAEGSQVHVPRVELPTISPPGAKTEASPLVGSESPTLELKVPLLEIAMPGSPATAEPVLGADVSGREGELRIPKAPPLLGIPTPKVELDLSLPSVGGQAPKPHGELGTEAKIKLPQVELLKFGRGEEAGLQLIGRGREQDAAGTAPPGAKIRVPKVDISLPKAQLPDLALPRAEGEVSQSTVGPEGWLRMPSVGLPKFSPPKGRAPEPEQEVSLEGGQMLPAVTLSSPALRLPRGKGLGLDGEAGAEMDLPQLELKVPKLRGTTEMPGTETGGEEGRGKVSAPPHGFGLCKAAGEAVAGTVEDIVAYGADSKLKLKIPSLSLSKAGTEPRADTQPLCPSPKEEEVSFKMPQITLPDVGFSVDEDGKKEAKVEAGKRASAEGLEVEGFEASLKMPKIKMPVLEVSLPKEGWDTAALQGLSGSAGGEPDERRAPFRVPGVELSAPTLKAHAEYEVEGTQLWHLGRQEEEAAGRRVQKSPGGKEEASDVEAGKRYKVKIPKFGLSLSKAGEGVPGPEDEAKAKRSLFVLGRPREKGAEGGAGLLEGEEETDSGGVMGRFKLRSPLGLSLSKPKTGPEINGEPEDGGAEKGSSKVKLPKLGFSMAEDAQLNGARAEASLQNGPPDGKSKPAKLWLPQVELSSPSAAAERDPELSLQLVRADEAKEGSSGAFAALKFKPPKIALSSFKKRDREAASGAVVASAARTEMASLEGGNVALKSPKFKFPKLALSPKAHGVLGFTSEGQSKAEEAGRGSEEGVRVQVPQVGFSEEAGGP